MITKRILPILAVLVYLPVFVFLFIVGAVNGNFIQVMVFLGLIFCLAIFCYRLWKEKYLPKYVCGIGSALFGLIWFFQVFRRIEFILREGGMERADGYGSPLAFLVGMIFEGLILAIPAVILMLIAIRHRNPSIPLTL